MALPELVDLISPETAGTLDGLLRERAARRVALSLEPWSIENGLLTPTLKLKRARVVERHGGDVERIYAGH